MMSDSPPRLWPELTVDEFHQWWNGAPLLWGGMAFEPPSAPDSRGMIEAALSVPADGLEYCLECHGPVLGHAWALWCIAAKKPFLTITRQSCDAPVEHLVLEMLQARRLFDPRQFDALDHIIKHGGYPAAFLSSSFLAIHKQRDAGGNMELVQRILNIVAQPSAVVFFGGQRYG